MDPITAQIAEFAAGFSAADLDAEARSAARLRVVDTVGCALGGAGADVTGIARAVAPVLTGAPAPGAVIGAPRAGTTAEAATFLNTVMLRYLDFNDWWYPGVHPSDCLGALLAVGGPLGVSGQRLLSAMVVSYEVSIGLAMASGSRERGWDQGLPVGIGLAAGMGNLLGLSARQIGHAVSIMASSSVPLRVSRSGQLSNWKGAATAYACRNAVFAADLAAQGMTAPDEPFAGRNGVFDLVTGPFELAPFGSLGGRWCVAQTRLKYWPVCGNLQVAAWAAAGLAEQVAVDDVVSVRISTSGAVFRENSVEPEKWAPRSRETADHSLPYVFSRALLGRGITARDFADDAIADPRVADVMAKLDVVVAEDIDTAPLDEMLMRVEATDVRGGTCRVEVRNPAGHRTNPLTADDVRAKFDALVSPLLGQERSAHAFATWAAADTLPDLAPALALLEL